MALQIGAAKLNLQLRAHMVPGCNASQALREGKDTSNAVTLVQPETSPARSANSLIDSPTGKQKRYLQNNKRYEGNGKRHFKTFTRMRNAISTVQTWCLYDEELQFR